MPHNGLVYRPVREDDGEFLYRVYASTRVDELSVTGWSDEQTEAFLRSQFHLQHTQYTQNYPHASFDVILHRNVPVGRLYVDRRENEIRVIDIALLKEHRGEGIGSRIMEALNAEADGRGVPVTLHVEPNNPAMAMYERLGYERREQVGLYWFMERRPLRTEPCVAAC